MTDDPLAWETTDTGVDYTCPGFDVRRDEVVLPDGTETEYHYVEEPPAVVVLPFTPDGDVVVIDEWRQAVGRVNRSLPAGSMEDRDGDVETAARRELREETGYVAGDVTRLVSVEPINGLATSLFHYVVAAGCEPAREQDLDADESIRPTTVAYDDFLDAVTAGEVRDGKAVTGLLYYEQTR
ncbi:MAG: NUDIX hydrolase [Halobacteriaceae archaeon]